MKETFPWLPYPGLPPELAPAEAFGPRVPIELRANGRASQVLAMVDTGSDGTYVPATSLERLGLTGKPAGTEQADFPFVQERPVRVEYHEVELALGPWVASMMVGFADWEITHPEALLGRDVTAKFAITLDGPGRMTTIALPERQAQTNEAA